MQIVLNNQRVLKSLCGLNSSFWTNNPATCLAAALAIRQIQDTLANQVIFDQVTVGKAQEYSPVLEVIYHNIWLELEYQHVEICSDIHFIVNRIEVNNNTGVTRSQIKKIG